MIQETNGAPRGAMAMMNGAPTTATIPAPATVMIQETNGAPRGAMAMNQRKTMDMIQKMNGTMAIVRAQTMATIPAPATAMIQAPTTATNLKNGPPKRILGAAPEMVGIQEKKSTTGL